MPPDFHFLDPEWFLTLPPLGAVLWRISRRGTGAGAWQRVVDPRLLPHLLVQGSGKARRLPQALLAAGWLIAVIALANPTFERLPVPAYRGELARVVVLDLSRSMEAADLEPSRLARARYKVADILARSRDGQVGLIAFAGDAFVVSPLTDDADTIMAMLDAVVPDVMPVQGSRPDLALTKAAELLDQAGASHGEVVLVGDAPGGPRALAQARALHAAGHSLSVIGVGTAEGAPIPGVRGDDQRPVMARLDADGMRALATAGGGVYAPLSADARDLDRVLQAATTITDQRRGEAAMQTEVWNELGPWVLLAVLPLGALAFRRGWLLALALVIGNGALMPRPAMALSWDDLWQRPDQQAAAALERGEHEKARDLAEGPQRRGTASYRLGDFEAAAEAFAASDQSDSHYNRGNALAKAGRLEEAVAAYAQALAKEPRMEDAAHNKAVIEELLKKQQKQQPQSKGQDGQKEDQSGDQQGGQASQPDQDSGDQSRQGEQSTSSDGAQASSEADPQAGSGSDEPSDEQQGGGQEQESAADERQGGEQDGPQEHSQGGEAAQQTGKQPAGGQDNADVAADGQDPDEIEQAAADYREQAAAQEEGQEDGQDDGENRDASSASPQQSAAEALSPQAREERQAAQQWLRRIPDDPAGLLRRKFLYQYRSRAAQDGAATAGDPW